MCMQVWYRSSYHLHENVAMNTMRVSRLPQNTAHHACITHEVWRLGAVGNGHGPGSIFLDSVGRALETIVFSESLSPCVFSLLFCF